MVNFKNPEGQLARWLETLSAFDFKIQHRPGLQHKNADALSRLPCRQCGYDPSNQLQKQSVLDKPQDKSPKSHVNVVKLASESKDLCLNIREVQNKDHELKQVKSWLESTSKPAYEDISGLGYVLRSLWSQWDSLVVENGIYTGSMMLAMEKHLVYKQ